MLFYIAILWLRLSFWLLQLGLRKMKYSDVYIGGMGYEIPPNVLKTDVMERQLAPVYGQLNIGPGKLQMMTGLRERRFWNDNLRPSQAATKAAINALERSPITIDQIGALVNCSVCRDYLEPSTATLIANNLNLRSDTLLFDVSNACLGFATGLSVVANMIELGQIEAGLVVSAEAASEVVENTIKALVSNPSEELLLASIPSLTLGSGSVAYILCKREIAPRGLKFEGGISFNDSKQSNLCLWGPDTGFPSQSNHTMVTDGKTLLETGTKLAANTWKRFVEITGHNQNSMDVIFSHQVGILHRNVVFDALGLDVNKDYTTFEYLGNTGSAAMPITMAIGIEKGAFKPGQKAVLMGIGSGLVCTMYSVHWEAGA